MADDMIYTTVASKEWLEKMFLHWQGMRILVVDEMHIYRREGEEWIDEGPVTTDGR